MSRLSYLHEFIVRQLTILEKILSERKINNAVNDPMLLNAILHILQTSIQALIDMGFRIISELGQSPPTRYRDLPSILKEINILKEDLALKLEKMIGFRNIIVHIYANVDEEILLDILKNRKFKDIIVIANEFIKRARKENIDP